MTLLHPGLTVSLKLIFKIDFYFEQGFWKNLVKQPSILTPKPKPKTFNSRLLNQFQFKFAVTEF